MPDLDPFPLIIPAHDLHHDESYTEQMSLDEVEVLFRLEATILSTSYARLATPKSAPYVIDLTADSDAEDGCARPHMLECPSPSVPIKREYDNQARSCLKSRRRDDQEVNIIATRVWLVSEGKRRGYTWKRGYGEQSGCWARRLEDNSRREEVEGEYLLCYAFDLLRVEVRANADWLLLTL
ncbi:hypothetical protein GGR54DRAFT_620594 [Hypoxylon sp. NC1633]|nr:hypothetical protein GGR54DRAFT_620594 [Hypoxylon sp. NC1633]